MAESGRVVQQAVPATSIAEATVAEGAVAPAVERSLVLWLTNVSHGANHYQGQMVSFLYPEMMRELGFGPAQLGLLNAITLLIGQAVQGVYGFLAPFASRCKLLGLGNLVLGLATLLTGLVGSFSALIGTRTAAAVGASAQHPVGSSLLSGYFPEKRGAVLGLNTSISFIGSMLAPISVGFLLVLLGWRQVIMLIALVSVAVGIVYLIFRDRVDTSRDRTGPRKARLAQGMASYVRVLRNRNFMVISVVMMVGASGRGAGLTDYLSLRLRNAPESPLSGLGIASEVAGIILSAMWVGAIIGPLGFGWLSDRLSRKAMLQASLLLSALATIWLGYQGAHFWLLLLSVLAYGTVTFSRGTLTQALVADSVSHDDLDAAFSAYSLIGFVSGPIWALIAGVLMQVYGFSFAFAVMALSYLVGMLLIFLIIEPPSARGPAPTGQI